MSSTVLAAPANHEAQGRSASGRNGGVRKITSSNIDCHARFLDLLLLLFISLH